MAEEVDPIPFPESLCHRCAAHRVIRGARSAFLLCTALAEKYPRQPVRSCRAFRPEDAPDRSA